MEDGDRGNIKEARESGMQWRCFHCLRWFKEKPQELCPYCGCPWFTHISKVEVEDKLIDESAEKAAKSGLPEGYITKKFSNMEIEKIRNTI